MISYILAVFAAVAVIAADQLTKYAIVSTLSLGESMPVIDKLFDFTYIHNQGGAWGMLNGRTWLLLSVTVVAMLACVALLLKIGKNNKLLFWAICLVLGGGIGNMIDRIFRGGNVVDFIHVQFIDFPIFNVADCAVVIGAGILLIYLFADFLATSKKTVKPTVIELNDETDG